MIAAFILFGLFLAVTAFIMPWVNRSSIKRLEDELRDTRRSLRAISTATQRPTAAAPSHQPRHTPPENTLHTDEEEEEDKAPFMQPVSIPAPPRELPPSTMMEKEDKDKEGQDTAAARPMPHRPAVTTARAAAQPVRRRPAAAKNESFESRFGARLPVWGGGIALALAGVYLVKYSIDTGLLSPLVRTVLGTLFGFVLFAASEFVRRRPDFANGARIAQALAGAGVADLFACIYVAANVYHFIPAGLGFAAMAVVTVAGVALAVIHGPPVALLGMAGGFLTPALMHMGSPSAPMLFSYLFLLVAGLVAVAAWQRWWATMALAVAGGFLWVVAWLVGGYFGGIDGIVIGLFLLGCCAAVFSLTARLCRAAEGEPGEMPVRRINSAAAAIAIALMAVTAIKANYGLGEWMVYGLIAAGTLALAWLRPLQYRALPWLGLAGTGAVYAFWPVTSSGAPAALASLLLPQCWGAGGMCLAANHALVALLLGAMYLGAGALLHGRGRLPSLWTGLAATGSFTFLALAWFKMHDLYAVTWPWAAIAFALAGLFTLAVAKTRRMPEDEDGLIPLSLALQAAAAAGFTATGLFIQTPGEFLSVALAAEVLALAWLSWRMPGLPALRRIAAIIAGLFCVALARQAVVIAAVVTYSLFEARIHGAGDLPVMDWPLFQLGLPALLFFGAAWFLRRTDDDRLVRAFEAGGVMLAGLAAYYVSRHVMHPGENTLYIPAGFGERGVLTNVFFIAGLAALHLGRRYGRDALAWSGIALAAIAAFRLVWFDFLVHNPLFDRGQNVGDTLLWNSLATTYGLTVVWMGLTARALAQLGKESWTRALHATMLVSSFALVTLEVRQAFHGTVLAGGATDNAEIYTYSAVWGVFGLALLLLGTWTRKRAMRIAALGIMSLTAAKVFLYDAAALEGLYRVFSFLGLGLSLMGLGWFTARFVLPREEEG